MTMNQENTGIGDKLKTLRIRKGISLKKLAEDLGMSYSYLWGLENDKHSITIVNLQRISEYFDIDMLFFFTPLEPSDKVSLIRKKDAIKYTTEDGFSLKVVTAGLAKNVEVTRIFHPPNCPTERRVYNHKSEAEEFISVISGVLFVEVMQQEYMLEAGDSILFDSKLNHSIYTQTEPAEFFLISSPPYNNAAL